MKMTKGAVEDKRKHQTAFSMQVTLDVLSLCAYVSTSSPLARVSAVRWRKGEGLIFLS